MAGPNTHTPLNIYVGIPYSESLCYYHIYDIFLHGLVQEVFQIEIT